MRRSDSITNLAKALVLAKAEMEAPKKDKTAKITDTRSYSYADLDSVKKSYQPAIGKHGMFVAHSLAPVDGHVVLSTDLVHAPSGEFIGSDYPVPSFPKPQEQGSALTYFKRYNVCALLDIVAEDDDDGATAQAAKPAEKVKAPAPPAPKASVLTREEIESVHALAKKAGYKSVAELAPFLRNLCNVEKASELSKSELTAVLDALGAMAARSEKVPA